MIEINFFFKMESTSVVSSKKKPPQKNYKMMCSCTFKRKRVIEPQKALHWYAHGYHEGGCKQEFNPNQNGRNKLA